MQAVYSDGQEQARRRRNRNISLMLTGMDTVAIYFWQFFVSIIIWMICIKFVSSKSGRKNEVLVTIDPALQLLGVIVLNFACNIGEVVLSGVELGYTLRGSREVFAQSKIVVGVITINNFLKVVNSSLNFVIYCKDVVFRY